MILCRIIQQVNAEFIMQEKNCFSFLFSKYLPCSIFFVHATVGKPGFRGISTFPVLYFLLIFIFFIFFLYYFFYLKELVCNNIYKTLENTWSLILSERIVRMIVYLIIIDHDSKQLFLARLYESTESYYRHFDVGVGVGVTLSSFTSRFFHVIDKALSCQLSCTATGLVNIVVYFYYVYYKTMLVHMMQAMND